MFRVLRSACASTPPSSPVTHSSSSAAFPTDVRTDADAFESLPVSQNKPTQRVSPPTFDEILAQEKYKNKTLSSQDIADIRLLLNPPKDQNGWNKFVSRVKIALGLDQFEKIIEEAQEFLTKIPLPERIDKIPSVFIANADGENALHLALRTKRVFLAKQLIDMMTLEQITAPGRNGVTPLIIACQYSHKDLADAILAKEGFVANAHLSTKDDQGRNALHWAAGRNSYIAQKLIEHMSHDQITAIDNAGDTPLIIASKEGFTGIAQLLIGKMAAEEIFYNDSSGNNAANYLSKVCQNNLAKIFQSNKKATTVLLTKINKDNLYKLALLLDINSSQITRPKASTVVRAVQMAIEENLLSTNMLRMLVRDYIPEAVRRYYQEDPELFAPSLLLCMDILVPINPNVAARLGFQKSNAPPIFKSIATAKKNQSSSPWADYLDGILLNSLDVEDASKFLRGFSIAKRDLAVLRVHRGGNGRWTVEEAGRLVDYLLTLDDDILNPA